MANKEKNNKKFRFNIGYIFVAILGVTLLHDVWQEFQKVEPIPYSDFQKFLGEGRVQEVIVTPQHIRGVLKEPLADKKREFVTIRVPGDIANDLGKANVKFTGTIENTFLHDLLSWIVPVIFFFGIWLWIGRRMGGGGGIGGGFMSIGKSKAKIYMEKDIKVTFADVAGVEEAKEELREIVNFLKEPETYSRLGGRMPKGILLIGPPGTGKTLFAKAIAGEAGVPFFSISGSEFVEMFVGVGAARVRDLFEQARAQAPCIVFIDELDALGRARGATPIGGANDEKEQTLNQLLVELDGFDTKKGIILIAATNRPEILDPALLRAGRFDRQVLVDRPDKRGRAEILKVHLQKITVSPDVKLEEVANLTPGFTGADLANLVNEAALIATRRKADAVNTQDLTAAMERIVAGLERKTRLLNPKEKEVVAYHEMGHALVAHSLPGADPVHKISIIPRGVGALGYTIQRPTDDRYIVTKDELENKMSVLLGGRGAELLKFGHFSTGAADDLSKVTDIARNMVTRYAMSSKLGNVTYESEPVGFLGAPGSGFQSRLYSEETAKEIDEEVRSIVERAFEKTKLILEKNRAILESGSKCLLEKETLAEAEILEVFKELIKWQPGLTFSA